MNRLAPASQLGFSVAELLVAMAVNLIVLGIVCNLFISYKKTYGVQDDVVRMQQNARLAINAMAQDMRMAGYNHRQKGPAFSPFTTATGHNAVTFKCYSGASGPGFFKTSYVMSGNSIKRIVNGSVKQVFGNIDSLSFVYRDNGGNTINSNPTVAVTDLPKIRRVDLTIVAKTARPDRDYGLNGGYRTLTLTSSVSPRNMPD